MVQVKFGKMRTKQTQTKLMAKKLRNVRAEIKEIKKNQKIIEYQQKNDDFLEKINRINRHSTQLIKNKKR